MKIYIQLFWFFIKFLIYFNWCFSVFYMCLTFSNRVEYCSIKIMDNAFWSISELSESSSPLFVLKYSEMFSLVFNDTWSAIPSKSSAFGWGSFPSYYSDSSQLNEEIEDLIELMVWIWKLTNCTGLGTYYYWAGI